MVKSFFDGFIGCVIEIKNTIWTIESAKSFGGFIAFFLIITGGFCAFVFSIVFIALSIQGLVVG